MRDPWAEALAVRSGEWEVRLFVGMTGVRDARILFPTATNGAVVAALDYSKCRGMIGGNWPSRAEWASECAQRKIAGRRG